VLTDDVLELFDNKGEWLGLFFGVAEVLVLAHAPDEHEGLLTGFLHNKCVFKRRSKV
jgi:hypothetical protein